jgi:hypothetical protein
LILASRSVDGSPGDSGSEATIEADVRAERDEADRLKLSHPSKLQQKLTGQDANVPPISS